MDQLRETTLCFTGHRSVPDADFPRLCRQLDITITSYISKGYTTFIAGGAMGFDTAAAGRVMAAKKSFPQIRLILALPCRDQTIKWNSLECLNTYKRLLGMADEVIYMQDFYTEGCMHERNRFMVDQSSVCVAYMHAGGRRGGTAYTVKYAHKNGLTIVNLAPDDISQTTFC